MARFDKDTALFFEKVSEGTDEDKARPLQQISNLKRALRAAENPQKAIGRALVSGAVSTMLEKSAGVSVLGMFSLLNDHYKTSWWDWEPETLWQTLSQDHSFEATSEAKDLVMALQLAVSSNSPFEEWHVFEKVGHAFSQNHVNWAVLQPLGIDEAAVTLALLKKLRPNEPFDDEIYGYIAARAKDSGIAYLPKEIFGEKCQVFLDHLGNNSEISGVVANLWKSGTKEKYPVLASFQMAVLNDIRDYLKANHLGG